MNVPGYRLRAGLLASLLTLAACLLAACGSAGSASSRSAGTLVLYNGQHEQTTDSLVAGFEKATGINVEVRNDDEDTLADELVTEGRRSPADLVYTENTPALQYLDNRGLLAPIAASTLSHTPSRWTPATERGSESQPG
jgi:iron(III) transport system substrate-binding protein